MNSGSHVRMHFLRAGVASAALLALSACSSGEFMDRVKETAQQAAERETLNEVDDRVTGAVRCTFDNLDCIERAEEEGKPVEVVNEDGEVVEVIPGDEGAAGGDAAGLRPGEGAWANYDFVPGERVLFTEDFTNDNVGDFPRRLEFVSGNVEIVEWEGQRLLRGTGGDVIQIALAEPLPDRFTIEFDLHDPTTEGGTRVITEAAEGRRYSGPLVNVGHWQGSGIWEDGDRVSTSEVGDVEDELVSFRIMVDGTYAKVYAGERRISNIPNAELARGDRISFLMSSREDRPIYIGNIRVAAGGGELYQKLENEGRVATRGVLFATGSDEIQPESTPTLEEIGAMLTDNPDLRLTIEGHTDNVGDDAANQTLSEQRAEAVRQYLVSEHGIDAGRLEAAGLGATRPVASNDTPEGREQNRRVELVRP